MSGVCRSSLAGGSLEGYGNSDNLAVGFGNVEGLNCRGGPGFYGWFFLDTMVSSMITKNLSTEFQPKRYHL